MPLIFGKYEKTFKKYKLYIYIEVIMKLITIINEPSTFYRKRILLTKVRAIIMAISDILPQRVGVQIIPVER